MSAARTRVDVFSDVVCPWCFIGAARLDRALDSLGLSATADVRYHPFLLDPDAPEGGLDLREELRRKYGVDPKDMFARVESAARESGIPLDLSKLRFSFPTVRAHALLRHAGPKGTQSALAKALFRAYFLDGRNISDLDVLVPLGAEHGFESDEASRLLVDERELQATRRDAEEARRSGIRGVPFYVLNERVAVSGAQPESVFRNSLLMPEGG